jgi:FixJ family two-component response regulator
MATKLATVAVIEDDAGMRSALARMLGMIGWNVKPYASADEFFASRPSSPIDCLVIDVHLPGESGFALYRRFAGAGSSKTPAVFISAHDSARNGKEAAQLGFPLLSKPFDGCVLIEAVRAAMSRS